MESKINKLVRCSHCEDDIKEKSPAISCSVCLSWFHKGCSGLTTKEFNKQTTLWKRCKETSWTCDTCQKCTRSGQTVALAATRPGCTPGVTGHRLSIGVGAEVAAQCAGSEDRGSDLIQAPVHHVDQVSLRDIMDKLNIMESQYTSLLTRYEDQMRVNDELKSEIAEIKLQLLRSVADTSVHVSTTEVVSDSVREINERQSRKKNIMIFGVPEAVSSGSRTARDLDIDTTLAIVLKVHPGVNTQNIRVSRVGRDTPSKHRPLKVILNSEEDVLTILRRAKELKKIDSYKDVHLANDRTRRQMEEYRALKATLEARIQNGERDLKIKYVSGYPRIVRITDDLN